VGGCVNRYNSAAQIISQRRALRLLALVANTGGHCVDHVSCCALKPRIGGRGLSMTAAVPIPRLSGSPGAWAPGLVRSDPLTVTGVSLRLPPAQRPGGTALVGLGARALVYTSAIRDPAIRMRHTMLLPVSGWRADTPCHQFNHSQAQRWTAYGFSGAYGRVAERSGSA